MTAQDKICHVANKLGLTSLKDMQGSTGAVYDVDLEGSGQIFTNASRHQNPSITNINENQFQVNEALLVETIAFYCLAGQTGTAAENFQTFYGSNAIIIYDLIIGNKRVMKDTPVFASGSPFTFATAGKQINDNGTDIPSVMVYKPRHQTYMEGAGILIPPQIQWSVEFRIFDVVTGAIIPQGNVIGCYLYGTKVLLNFNTSI